MQKRGIGGELTLLNLMVLCTLQKRNGEVEGRLT